MIVGAGITGLATAAALEDDDYLVLEGDEEIGGYCKTIKKEGRFFYPGFGTWTIRQRKARRGRNPQTGAEIKIKASKTVGFKPAKELKSGL